MAVNDCEKHFHASPIHDCKTTIPEKLMYWTSAIPALAANTT